MPFTLPSFGYTKCLFVRFSIMIMMMMMIMMCVCVSESESLILLSSNHKHIIYFFDVIKSIFLIIYTVLIATRTFFSPVQNFVHHENPCFVFSFSLSLSCWIFEAHDHMTWQISLILYLICVCRNWLNV